MALHFESEGLKTLLATGLKVEKSVNDGKFL